MLATVPMTISFHSNDVCFRTSLDLCILLVIYLIKKKSKKYIRMWNLWHILINKLGTELSWSCVIQCIFLEFVLSLFPPIGSFLPCISNNTCFAFATIISRFFCSFCHVLDTLFSSSLTTLNFDYLITSTGVSFGS